MKKLLIFSVFISILFILDSCKDNPSDSPGNQINWPAGTITVSESLPNWTYGTGYSLLLIVYPSVNYGFIKTVIDSCPISSGGNFTIHFPILDNKYYDDTVNFYNIYCFDSIVIAPQGLRTVNSVLEIHKDGFIKGTLDKKVHRIGNDTTGTYYVKYEAFSECCLMTGQVKCYNWNGSEFDTTLTIFNENVNAGYNTVVTAILSKSHLKTEYGLSCFDPKLSTEWIYNMNKN